MQQFLQHLDPWIRYYASFLAVLFAVGASFMVLQCCRVVWRVRASLRALRSVNPTGDTLRHGCSVESFEKLSGEVGRLPDRGGQWWQAIDSASELYSTPESSAVGRPGGYFSTVRIDDLVTVDRVATGYSWSAYRAFPGVLTSLGLLGTFVALLFGLSGVSVDGQGAVQGLPGLISNLSGKFVTSVAALALTVTFVVLEMLCQAALRRARGRLVSAVSRGLPFLSPSRVLLDLQRQSVQQSTALRNISSDVVDKFAGVFRDELGGQLASQLSGSMATQVHAELGPSLEKLDRTMSKVSAAIERNESEKQESVTGQIRALTESLERSMSEAIAAMGRQFRDALSGSTKDQFGELAGVVKDSAGMLALMNQNFGSMQAAVEAIVAEARSSTSAQMRSGFEQTEQLNRLVEGLMVRLSESATQNQEQAATMLTNVVAHLSEKVQTLATGLAEAVADAAGKTQDAASSTLREAGAWSQQTSDKLHAVLSTLEARSGEFERAGQALLAAQNILAATLDRNHEALAAMGAAASEVRTYSGSLAGLQKHLEEGQRVQTQLAVRSAESVGKLVDAAAKHDAFISRYQDTFDRYRGAFEGIDTELARMLDTIIDRLQSYNRVVEANFTAIVESSNNVMPRMAGVLKQSSEDIREQLDELSDVLTKGIEALGSRSGRADRQLK